MSGYRNDVRGLVCALAGFYVAQVPAHATKLIYVKPDGCTKCK